MLYDRHLRVGVAAQAILVVLAVAGIHAGFERLLTVSATLVLSTVGFALPITLLGGIIPDLDESNSHVYRWFRPFVAVCAALCVFMFLYSSRERVTQAIQSTVRTVSPDYLAGIATVSIAILTCFVTYRLATRLLKNLTHRDLFHQLPTAVVITLVLYAEFVPFLSVVDAPRPPVTAAIFAVAFLVGFVSHLAADGLLLRRQTYIGKVLDEKF